MIAAILVGCSGSPTLEELEDVALVTGDWSSVEERERLLQRKRNPIECPRGYTVSCFEVGLRADCQCVRSVAGSGFWSH